MFVSVPFLLAFCSMIYELVLAHYISLYFGGTVFNFTLTIGIFLASMGVGAFWSARTPKEKAYLTLEKVEIYLCVLGVASPVITSWIGSLSLYTSGGTHQLLFVLCYILVMAIGILSGFEIPLLMGMTDRSDKKISVLAMDYFGSFAAAVVYPLLLIPHLGLVQTSLLAGFLNIGVSIWIGYVFNKRKILFFAEGALAAGILFLFVNALQFEELLRGWLYR